MINIMSDKVNGLPEKYFLAAMLFSGLAAYVCSKFSIAATNFFIALFGLALFYWFCAKIIGAFEVTK